MNGRREKTNAHLAQAIIDNIDASEEGSETRDADE